MKMDKWKILVRGVHTVSLWLSCTFCRDKSLGRFQHIKQIRILQSCFYALVSNSGTQLSQSSSKCSQRCPQLQDRSEIEISNSTKAFPKDDWTQLIEISVIWDWSRFLHRITVWLNIKFIVKKVHGFFYFKEV